MLSMMTVEELCRKLRPILGSQIDKLYMKFTLSSDRDTRAEIEQALNALFHKHFQNEMLDDTILLEPPKADIAEGEFPLAKVIYSGKEISDFSLRENDWVRHMCITGMSGSGKTTFAYQIIGSFMYAQKPFLIFDWKQSFRQLLDVDKKILIFPIGNESVRNLFRMNILQPPKNVGPREWINVLCDIITESYFASFGVHKLLSETINELFTDYGVYEGSGKYPTFHHVKQRLEDKEGQVKGGRASEWITSAIRICHSLTFGSFGEVINYKGNDIINIEELLNQQAIFELDSLSAAEKKFFSELILTYIFKLMKKNYRSAGGKFRYAIIVDEAHNIFLKDRANFMKETVTEMVYREIREYGVSLICLDQHISKLSEVVAGNSACNIAFQQMLPQDIETIANLMQLRDKRHYFSMLNVGEAIVKLAERYHKPFQIRAPNINISRGDHNDKEIEAMMVERIKELKRMKIFYHSCSNENLKHSLNRVNSIFHAAGVETTEEGVKQFVDSIEEPENVYEHPVDEDRHAVEPKKKKPARIVNHLQMELVGMINKLIQTERMEFRDVREYLIKDGHNKQDVNAALQYAYSSENLSRVEKEKEKVALEKADKETNKEPKSASEEDEEESESQYYADLQKRIAKYVASKLREGSDIKEVSATLLRLGHRREDVYRAIEIVVSENEKKMAGQAVETQVAKESVETQETEKPAVTKTDDTESNNKSIDQNTINHNSNNHNFKTNNNSQTHNSHSLIKKLKQHHWEYLYAIRDKHFSVTQLNSFLGLSGRKGNSLKKELEEFGLIKVVEERSSKGWKKRISLTELGTGCLNTSGIA